MSTSDVPGANPVNADNLHIGCWAEDSKDDGSYIMVIGLENGRVIFDVYDTRGSSDIIFYRDAMSEPQFKRRFSKTTWVWHDKQNFPWEVLMEKGAKPGTYPLSGRQTLAQADRIAESMQRIIGDEIEDDSEGVDTAARRVAIDLGLQGRRLTRGDRRRFRRALGHIVEGLQAAIAELGA